MRRLLAVSWEMPPMYGPRATQVSRVLGALPALGWRPTAVCLAPKRGGPHWPDGVLTADPPGVDVVRVPSPEESLAARVLWRILPALRDHPDGAQLWVPHATRAAASVIASQKPSGIITFAQPWSNHLIGLRLRASSQLPWVAHFSDPWVDSPYASARQRTSWRPMEEAVVTAASALVFVTEETADLVMRKYPPALRAKAAIVPHGFDSAAAVYEPTAPADPRRAMRILHAGRFYRGIRTPSALLRALSDMDRRQPLAGRVEVRFLGPHGAEFAREAAALNLGGLVTFADRVSPDQAARAAADADVLLVVDAPSHGPSVFLPSKLVDYLPFRKPILGLTPEPGASARLLRRLGCAVAPPDDSAAIARVLENILQRWRTGTLRVGESFDAVAAQYDIRCTARALHDLLARTFA